MSETQQQTLAIEALVRGRCEELGLRPAELVRRCGYQNVSKGLRRLEQLCAGNFTRSVGLVRTLPAALEVPVEVVKEAIETTERYLHESAEAAWRAAFRPHAIIITERSPSRASLCRRVHRRRRTLARRLRPDGSPRHVYKAIARRPSSEARKMAR